MHLSHFYSYFHECNHIFLGLRHGSHPPHKGTNPISQNLITDKAIRSWIGQFLIWAVKHDRRETHDCNVTWIVVPTPHRASVQQESQTQSLWGRWPSLEKAQSGHAWPQSKVFLDLRRPVCGEEGLLRRSLDPSRHGWERLQYAHQLWCYYTVLFIREPPGATSSFTFLCKQTKYKIQNTKKKKKGKKYPKKNIKKYEKVEWKPKKCEIN